MRHYPAQSIFKYCKDIDNPDQRIAEDAASFCQQSMEFFINCLESFVVVTAFSLTLWSISPNLVIALSVYTILAYSVALSSQYL
jgi:putative ATP-binding cassette transporter